MTPGARLAAAIEVLDTIERDRRPAAEGLKDWGTAHRFAGSKDRAGIALLVYDALRLKASSAWIAGADTPRAVLAGSLRRRGRDMEAIEALFSGEGHAPAALEPPLRDAIEAARLDDAPAHVRADVPKWLAGRLAATFPDTLVAEGEALAARAPVDLRVNLIKATRDKAARSLAHLGVTPTPFSPIGLRMPAQADGRAAALTGEPAHAKGLVEVQDEGSQIAALLSGAAAGTQVVDLCAGGGGKTLALAAMMGNKGQLYAHDDDGRRLMPILPRLERAGVRNAQVRAPRGSTDVLADLAGRCDLVFVDAPCTGSGTWRRNPDAKWRMRPGALDQRVIEQDEVLARAVPLLKVGGRLVYVTCSLLREENEDRVAALLAAHPELLPLDVARLTQAAGMPELAAHASRFGPGLRLSPATTGTDGFYVAALVKG